MEGSHRDASARACVHVIVVAALGPPPCARRVRACRLPGWAPVRPRQTQGVMRGCTGTCVCPACMGRACGTPSTRLHELGAVQRSPAVRPVQAASHLPRGSEPATGGGPAQAAVESSEADWEGRLQGAVDSAEQWKAFADKLAAERGALDAELAVARTDAQARPLALPPHSPPGPRPFVSLRHVFSPACGIQGWQHQTLYVNRIRAPARRARQGVSAVSGRPHPRAQGLRAELQAATAAAAGGPHRRRPPRRPALLQSARGTARRPARWARRWIRRVIGVGVGCAACAGGAGALHASAMSPEVRVAGGTGAPECPWGCRPLEDPPSSAAQARAAAAEAQAQRAATEAAAEEARAYTQRLQVPPALL